MIGQEKDKSKQKKKLEKIAVSMECYTVCFPSFNNILLMCFLQNIFAGNPKH